MRNGANSSIADFGLRLGDRPSAGRQPAACRLGPALAGRAKQSQFRGSPTGTGGPIVRNEPNSRRVRVGRGVGAVAPNKANPGPAGRRENVRNEPNSVRGPRQPSAWWGKSYGGLDMQQTAAERSQFRRVDRASPLRRLCETKPNLGKMGHLGMVPNKPNSVRPAGRPGPWKKEMCETNPILGRVSGTRDMRSVVQTKPIAEGRISHHFTIPSFQHSPPAPGVQTKPSLLSWTRQTKPVTGGTKCRLRRQP